MFTKSYDYLSQSFTHFKIKTTALCPMKICNLTDNPTYSTLSNLTEYSTKIHTRLKIKH